MNRDKACALVTSLYEGWYSSVVRYVYRMTGSFDLAEDIVQESFMLLYRELQRGTRIENPQGWTLCVVRRQTNRQLRALIQREGSLEPLDVLENLPAALRSWQLPSIEKSDALRLLSVLTPREEEVLLLRMEALKYREIATQLGISPNSVNTLLARALRKLHKAAGIDSAEEANTYEKEKAIPEALQRHKPARV